MLEYNRLKQRTEHDLEMISATGVCKGIENYARHFTGKALMKRLFACLII